MAFEGQDVPNEMSKRSSLSEAHVFIPKACLTFWITLVFTLSTKPGYSIELTLPDSQKTPGLARDGLSKSKVCSIKWGSDARHVTAAMKKQVFEEYDLSGNDDPACVPDAHGRHCEIDHLISRELAGADDVKNLWPQPYGTQPWNAARKDRLENRLHKEVCAGNISLQDAQDEIKTDWRKPYVKYFGEPQ